MEAKDGPELIAWPRAFGLTQLLSNLSEPLQRAWEEDFIGAAELLRRDGYIRLGGTTRIVVAK